ncbi:MAG: aminotransferase class I/II-fold pyridoxal phosphate-dependent enzyme [Candidatus Aerophobus sp.]|nr:MAG: aminotransferase class I/II-fold pyridoxal phosphate-dependent enzyme [Candidatus Aerophobus sp.]
MRFKGISTVSVHAGEYIDEVTKAVVTPIFQSSTFLLSDTDYRKILQGREREINIYTREGNPNRRAVAEKMMVLEGGEDALTFSSGMAAISASLLALLERGDHLVSTLDLYGGSNNLLRHDFPSLGIETTFVDSTNLEIIEASVKANTRALFFESLSNPLLKILNLPKIIKIAQKHQLTTVVDNTFLTPYNLRPLDWGIDLVVHSASKYLNGHSDIIAGVSVAKKSLIDKIWKKMVRFGGSMDPHQAFLLERGLKTFALRMKHHNENGEKLARYLEGHTMINRVIYPGLESYSQKELAKGLLKRGSGGMVSFEVKGGNEVALEFMKKLRIIREATSLGGVESLVSMPFNTSHAGLTREEKESMGIEPGLVRLSCGIEDPEDLIEDVDQALSRIDKVKVETGNDDS